MPQKIVDIVMGETYHVFNRGVDKRDIFLDKSDYLRFYQILNLFNSVEAVINFDSALVKAKAQEYAEKLVTIEAYSLLPNHYHLIIKQNVNGGLSEFMRRVSLGYTSYFNSKNERSGVLFQGTFKRVHVENQEQYQYLLAYVNENHFVHNVSTEREICHSSSLHYQGLAKSKLISHQLIENYSFTESLHLAKEIYKKRMEMKFKKTLLE